MQLTDDDQANHITVWHALSELFTGRERQAMTIDGWLRF
ncbi:hypothetical protein SAMN05192562_10216 [Kosakonia arachidis]|uniref:Uncharacterized protein n=1 Tax=Kosakonia arachidis TaxID=551989 RepID=A0A1I7AR22_9ENTR|nr:hypothetical protein SAMN05192562_10216 [Kosakonia arachidis]